MDIAYVTIYDPNNAEDFGGRGYYMAQSLKQHLSLRFISLGRTRKRWYKWYTSILMAKKIFYTNFLNQTYSSYRDPLLIKDYSRQISRKLSELKVDIVFSPISPGSQPIAYLECDKPIVIWTDTTLAGAIEIYPEFKSFCVETLRDGLANERSALSKCSLAIYTSEWAAESAIKHYQIDPSRVKVVPFGPNSDSCNRTLDDIKTILKSRSSEICKLLFIGMDWNRKGGEITVQVAKELNRMGIKTELTIVGCNPPLDSLSSFIKPFGYINKATKEGNNKINRLYAESHFLILPTLADCTPVVFNEACSFGLPCISTDVGGISTIIKDGLNGKKFPISAKATDYSDYISVIFTNYTTYTKLALSSFKEYQSRLNWAVSVKKVKKLLTTLI